MTEAEIEGMLFEDGGRGCEVGNTSDLQKVKKAMKHILSQYFKEETALPTP